MFSFSNRVTLDYDKSNIWFLVVNFTILIVSLKKLKHDTVIKNVYKKLKCFMKPLFK